MTEGAGRRYNRAFFLTGALSVRRAFAFFLACFVMAFPVQAAVAEVGLAPHRATYKMALASVRNGSPVADVEGEMVYEFSDACDGWVADQKLSFKFYYGQGQTLDRTTHQSSWEAKDGKLYRFITESEASDGKSERFRGTATLNAGGRGVAVYSEPKEQKISLDAGTLLPSAHTAELIKAAEQGQMFFNRSVFDGNDDQGPSEVSAFIGKRIDEVAGLENEAGLKANPLLKVPAWPVRMAFFTGESGNGLPDYEIGFQMLSNGITRAMMIDYGDFTLSGTLTALEVLPRPQC